jgi:tetrahydromethanopterin S-methyltransferase subunit C
MPSPAFTINGSATTTSVSIAAGGAITATLASTVGVNTCAWTLVRTDDTSLTTSYALAVAGAHNETCTTTALLAGTAAALQCVINGGIDTATGEPSSACTATGKFYVPTSDGVEVLVADEQNDTNKESSAAYGMVRPINRALRLSSSLGTFRPEAYGAIADLQFVTNGTTVATDATLTSASNPFVAGDVGKTLRVRGAGLAGADHFTTIASFTSAGSVEMADVALTSVAGTADCDWGTDNGPAIQLALDAAKAAGGGVVQLSAGSYGVCQNLGLTSATGVTVRGSGNGATRIVDGRADTAVGAPTGAYYGLLSFVNCSDCALENVQLEGAVVAFDGVQTAQLGRKGLYANACPRFRYERVTAKAFRDEALYNDGDCPGISGSFCIIRETNLNGINCNSTAGQSKGARFMGNWVERTWFSPMQVAAESAEIVGNILSNTTAEMIGVWLLVVDCHGHAIVNGNTVYDSDMHLSGTSAIAVFGTANPDAVCEIANNTITGIDGYWFTNGVPNYCGAGIEVRGHSGTVSIHGNTIVGCCATNVQPNRAILVRDLAATGVVTISGNTIRNIAGDNLTTGIEVVASVAGGLVIDGGNHFVGIATPWKTDGSAVVHSGTCYVSSITVDHTTNPNPIPIGVSRVLVDCSGGDVTCTMPPVAANAEREVQFLDHTRSATTHNITIEGDGAEQINGAANVVSTINGQPVTVYGLPDGSAWVTTAPVL